MNLWLAVFGLVSGVLGGMGMGGGTLLIPLLTIFGGVEQQVAQAINLLTFLPMGIFALILHMKNKLINFKIAWIVMLPALITAVIGAFVAQKLLSSTLRDIFAMFLIIIGFFQLFSVFMPSKEQLNK